jgi:quercetin dioxygenase-like cupin family protein
MSTHDDAFIAEAKSLDYTFRAKAGTKPTWTPRWGFVTDEPRFDPRFKIGGQFGGWFYGVRAYACAAVAIATAMPAAAQDRGETITPHFEQAIPNIPGKSLVALVVDYAPGGASPSHTHAKSAFIFAYVLSGEIESQVNDGPKRVYRAGESWYETPGSIHRVSRNASKTEPAKLLAVFVVDTDDKNLTTPVKE